MTKLESGRSMVEMLGVLAIIGVLSIGGIMGYNMAMNRYKANNVLAAAAQIATIGQTANNGLGKNVDEASVGGLTGSAATAIDYTAADKKITITLAAGETGVGTAINSVVGGTACANTSCTLYMVGGRLKATAA